MYMLPIIATTYLAAILTKAWADKRLRVYLPYLTHRLWQHGHNRRNIRTERVAYNIY